MNVWAVTYGNYDPSEVVALYDNEAAAYAHANREVGHVDDLAYEVRRMLVRSSYQPQEATP